jgi:hypothetical protein
MKKFARGGIIALVCLLATTPGNCQVESTRNFNNLNGGYYLLHKLYEDESQLPLLLDLKTASPELHQFADKISRTAKEGMSILDRMRYADPHMKWDKNPLPKVEQDVRESVQDEKEHQLLFGTEKSEFARAFLVSQAEATNYAANIDKVLAEQDNYPGHERLLKQMSAEWRSLYGESLRLLRQY